MKTYVVFDRKTGEVLRTHVQTDDDHDPTEHIIKTGNPDLQRTADILEVDALTPGASYRVDTKTKKLLTIATNQSRGSGAAFVQPSAGDLRSTRKSFVDVRTAKKL